MAGGSGTRLWPLSRKNRPKQLLKLHDGRSLLRHSFDRLAAFLPPADIHVIALAEHRDAIAAELPELPADNFIGEPCGRDTAAAIALAAALLRERRGDCTMGVFTADHYITPVEKFVAAIERGYAVAEKHPQSLIAFGIRPTRPETGYGYLHAGKAVEPGVLPVLAFMEKPDAATAQRYLDDGRYFWNSGMFVWRTGTILAALRTHLPDTHDKMVSLAKSWGSSSDATQVYASLKKISIDYAVMEPVSKTAPSTPSPILCIEMALDWLDVGSYSQLGALLHKDAKGNMGNEAHALLQNAEGNIVVTECVDGTQHIVASGVSGLIIVHTRDATLVCRRDDEQGIKDLVARLPAAFQ